MKTVIVQTLWGHGILYTPSRSKHSVRGLHTYCIPSVRRYADRHGYSYILHRPDTPHFRFSIDERTRDGASKVKLNSITNNNQFNASFERYYVMNGLVGLYERFIYLDLDVYVKPDAPAMPHTKGVWAFHQWHRPYEHNLRRGFSDVPDKHQFNTGVLVMDREGVKSVYDYMCHVKPDLRCTGDQDYFRLWSVKNKVNHLDGVWNLMTSYMRSRDGHFIHYVEKRLIEEELASNYLIKLYSVLKRVERVIRRTRLFQFFRRLWKQRARA